MLTDNQAYMLYLLKCAVNGQQPDLDVLSEIDFKSVFSLCEFHRISSTVFSAVEPYEDILKSDFDLFRQAREKATRRTVLMNCERQKIFECFEKEKITYLPLKGVVLQDCYPKFAMREMSDNDIRFDPDKKQQVISVMNSLGYTLKSTAAHHFEFHKNPVFNFEMHFLLFSQGDEKIYEYFKNIGEKLIKNSENSYGCHLKDEDFFIHFVAHEYKHFKEGGIGIRTLADRKLFADRHKDNLDYEYINEQLDKIGLCEYNRKMKSLTNELFENGNDILQNDNGHFDFLVSSGAYGTRKNAVENMIAKFTKDKKLSKSQKIKYAFRRIFPNKQWYKSRAPFVAKHMWLSPFYSVYRLVRGLTVRRKNLSEEIKIIKGK